MNKIYTEIKTKLLYVSPKKINYCIYPSKFCDYNQFDLVRIHPHAGINRGVFDDNEKNFVKINGTNWDKKAGVKFTSLLEFIALKDHYTGKKNWKNSQFAKRNVNYIKSNKSVRGFIDYKDYLSTRERQIDYLINSIIKKGIFPKKNVHNKKKIINDNVSVVLTQNNQLYFNNRGHHRLSIAKILELKDIPVKIVVAKSRKIIKKFYLLNKKK